MSPSPLHDSARYLYPPLFTIPHLYSHTHPDIHPHTHDPMKTSIPLPPHPQDAPDAQPLILTEKRVDFDHVFFHYVDTTPILKDVAFTAHGGHTVALVGATGSGKSTCLRLLYRFYDVTGGRICIDGQDLRHVTLGSLRAAIGMVPQDVVLFNNTCKYNIRCVCFGGGWVVRDRVWCMYDVWKEHICILNVRAHPSCTIHIHRTHTHTHTHIHIHIYTL